MTTILCGLPAFQPMHQPGFPALDAGDKKFRLILRFGGVGVTSSSTNVTSSDLPRFRTL